MYSFYKLGAQIVPFSGLLLKFYVALYEILILYNVMWKKKSIII